MFAIAISARTWYSIHNLRDTAGIRGRECIPLPGARLTVRARPLVILVNAFYCRLLVIPFDWQLLSFMRIYNYAGSINLFLYGGSCMMKEAYHIISDGSCDLPLPLCTTRSF